MILGFARARRPAWVQTRVHLVAAFALAIAAIGFARDVHADLVVPANSVMNLGGGAVDLACTDLIVAGTLQVTSGSVINIRNVNIQGGGAIDGGSGLMSVGGNWTNAGTMIPGTSVVQFRDVCSLTSATISGTTTFSTASFVTTTGKNYVFATGSTQTVNALLDIAGTTPLPIQFRSSTPGQVASINLLGSGTQTIQHVGVTDVWATGQWLAPLLTNEGGGGNANRWFGSVVPAAVIPVPTLAESMLALMTALLSASGAWVLRRRRRISQDFNRPRR